MTIGVGFVCVDGIVLCADNQITWPANHKYYQSKLYKLGLGPGCAVAFTFAGSPNLMGMFFGKFEAAAAIVPSPHTVEQIQDLLETVLSLIDLVETDADGLHMLCGITAAKQTRLLKTERKVVTEVNAFDYVGVGDCSLLRYLAPLLARGRLHTTKQALNTGTYLVMQAKRYVDGCGGDTHAIILTKDGSGISFPDASQREQKLLGLEHLLGNAAKSFFDDRDSADEFRQTVDRLLLALKTARPDFTHG